MRRWLINVAKNETILIVAAILALISCFIVPPDADYKSYIHASTISQLICLMIVVCGFQRIGVFRIIGSRLLEKVSTMRGLVITLVALTFFSAMFITNDVALVTFVPFAVAVLIMAGQEDKTILVVTLMTIGCERGQYAHPDRQRAQPVSQSPDRHADHGIPRHHGTVFRHGGRVAGHRDFRGVWRQTGRRPGRPRNRRAGSRAQQTPARRDSYHRLRRRLWRLAHHRLLAAVHRSAYWPSPT